MLLCQGNTPLENYSLQLWPGARCAAKAGAKPQLVALKMLHTSTSPRNKRATPKPIFSRVFLAVAEGRAPW
eukprot:255014-Alexandrium_andersonii.AAC.1